jgi:hypothetical protein
METGSRTSTPRPSFQFDQFSHFHGTHTNHVIARLSYSPLTEAPPGSNGTEDPCVSNCDYAFALGERLLNMPPKVFLDDLLYGNAAIRRLATSFGYVTFSCCQVQYLNLFIIIDCSLMLSMCVPTRIYTSGFREFYGQYVAVRSKVNDSYHCVVINQFEQSLAPR